jgi:chitinase
MVGASGYDIERNGAVVASDVVGTSYSDTGLSPSTTYTYRARTVRA